MADKITKLGSFRALPTGLPRLTEPPDAVIIGKNLGEEQAAVRTGPSRAVDTTSRYR